MLFRNIEYGQTFKEKPM